MSSVSAASPSSGGIGPSVGFRPTGRGWAACDDGSVTTASAGRAARHGSGGAWAATLLDAPAGSGTQRAWSFFAATAGVAASPESFPANGGDVKQRQLMRSVHSPLASVSAALSQLQGRLAPGAASLLTPGWARPATTTTTTTTTTTSDKRSWGSTSTSNSSTPAFISSGFAPVTTLLFASVTSAHAPTLSPLGGAAGAAAPLAAAGAESAGSVATAVAAAAAAKAEVGRATWTLLHTLAAQFPDRPSRQQQRDARTLVDCLTRIYPCGDCARHFAELVKLDPPVVSSGPAFRRWLCAVHNRVNARIGKPTFNCDLVEARWAPLGCSAAEAAAGEEGMLTGGGGAAGCELLGVGSRGPQRRWG